MARPNASGKCGYCHHDLPEHSKNCKRKTGTARVGGPPAKPRAGNKRKPSTPRRAGPKRKSGRQKGATVDELIVDLEAFRLTTGALEALPPDRRTRVLAAVCKFLSIETSELAA